MSMLGFFLRTSIHNLRRGGQRVLVAFLCVTFGVMSLVAMMMLSQSIARMLVVAPQHLIGADISMVRRVEDFVLPEHIQELKALQQSGVIRRFSLVAYTSALTFRVPGSGERHFLSAGIGIDPASPQAGPLAPLDAAASPQAGPLAPLDAAAYPLIGALTVSQPGNTGLSTLLQGKGDILVTRDVAIENHLKVGDSIILSDLHTGAPVTCRIRGIISDTPNHQGSKIYYNHETAAKIAGDQIAGRGHTLNTVLVTAVDPAAAQASLTQSGWSAWLATDQAANEKMAQQMFELTLNGAGIFGLLVGGIGIANTMQVLLQRRRKEVAVWKTLGYRPGQLQLLFALEAALLGAVGSLAGAALGVGLSWVLVDLFSRITTLLITWTFSPLPAITGFLVGLVTAVTFAMFAIVVTSQVKPLALLRSESLNAAGTASRASTPLNAAGTASRASTPLNAAHLPWLQSAGLVLLFTLPLTAVTSLVMGSLTAGIGVLLVALFGLIGLGGLMVALKWIITRLLPLKWLPLAHMAQKNLRRRGSTLVFAMIALFTGVVSLSLGAVVTQNAGRVMDERTIQVEGDNITILAPAGQEQAIREAIAGQPVEHSSVGYQSTVRSIRVPASGSVTAQPDTSITPVLIGRSEPSDYVLKGAAWGSEPGGVYTYQLAGIPVGSQVEVTLWDGSTRVFPVVGSYSIDFQGYRPQPGLGLLMPVSLFQKTTPAETVQFYARAPARQVQQTSASLGVSLPGATVINLLAYAARFIQTYQNLFVFAVAMAGLALLAGVLLVANSVSLGMLDRRYEIGVLKALGYARRHILTTLVVEYSLVALAASAAGLAAVAIFLWVVGLTNHLAGSLLVMRLPAAGVVGAASTGLALLTVLLTTWGPVQVSPAIVLNDRD